MLAPHPREPHPGQAHRSARSLGLSLLVAATLVAGSAAAARVLPPSAQPPISAALGRIGAGWHFDDAAIDHEMVKLRLCAEGGSRCVDLRLVDPPPDCPKADLAGPFCILDGAALPAPVHDSLVAAFASVDAATVWGTPAKSAAASPRSGPGIRIGGAVGLLALAALIAWGLRRERKPDEPAEGAPAAKPADAPASDDAPKPG